MLLKRILPSCISSVLALSLCACGGGGSGGSSSNDSNNPQPQQASLSSIEGSVVKGIVVNALVSAYDLDTGSVGSVLATTTTDQYGNFNIQLQDHQGPVYIEVTPNGDDTTMKCDSASGCGTYVGLSELDNDGNGNIDFGEFFTVPSDFQLTSAIADASNSTSTSVTTLSHMATQLALTYPQGLNDVSLQVAQSQVENLFEVDNISDSESIDLTDPAAVASAQPEELKLSLMSSSLIGLTNDVAFAQVLDDLVDQFVMNDGQLITRDEGNAIPTLLDLVEESLATAQLLELDDQATSLLQNQTQLLTTESGDLTDSEASPTAGGSSAEVIDAFMADLAAWQGYLSLSPEQTSFSNVVSSIGVSTGADLAQLLKAISIAGQFGPVVALPDAALSAACSSLGNYLYQVTCRILVSGRSLQDICEGSLNLVIFNRSLCDILNDLTLPLGNGLTGHFALYDGIARIYGTTEGVDVDVTFTALNHSNSSYGFSLQGTAETETGSLEISDGDFQLVFEGGLDIMNLKLPEQASGNISVAYEQYYSVDVPAPTSFDGTLTLELDLSGVRETEEEEEASYSGLDNIEIIMVADGQFESSYGDQFEGSIALSGGADSNIVVEFEADLPDYSDRAVITLTSTPEQMVDGQINSIEMAWGGKQYEILYFNDNYQGVRISNQDNIILDLELGLEDEETAGYLMLNATSYGTISKLNGGLLFELSNGLEWVF